MKNRIKYCIVLLLVVSLTIGGIVCPERKADAMVVWIEQIIYPHGGQAKKDEQNWCEFKCTVGSHAVSFYFRTSLLVGLTYEIQDTVTKETVKKDTIPADSEEWKEYEYQDQGEKIYVCTPSLAEKDMPEQTFGKYRITYSFDEDTDYTLSATQSQDSGFPPLPKPHLNKSELTLSKGFKEQLKLVSKHGDTFKWSSSEPSVASVDQKGVVKAKKTGTALITVKQYNGETDYCVIKVKKNSYTAKTPTVRSVEKGTSLMKVCHVSATGKGALKVQAVFVNHTDHMAVKFRKLQIQMKNKKGKTIFTYKKKGVGLKVKSGRSKWFTFVIPKSKLKQKKLQDLRQSSVKLTRKVSFSLEK